MYGLLTHGHVLPEHRAILRIYALLLAAVFFGAVILDLLFHHILGIRSGIDSPLSRYFSDHVAYRVGFWISFAFFIGASFGFLMKAPREVRLNENRSILPNHVLPILSGAGILLFAGAVSFTFSGNLSVPADLRPAGALLAFDLLYALGAFGLSDAVLFWRARKLVR